MKRQRVLALLGVAAALVVLVLVAGGHVRHLLPVGGDSGGAGDAGAHGGHSAGDGVLEKTECARLEHGKVAHSDEHVFVVHAVDVQPMYTREEAERVRPDAGELVLSGRPVEVSGDHDGWLHLGVHVCRRDSGRVARGRVALTLVGREGARRVPVVAMQEIGRGPLTYHYGNNVRLDGRGATDLLIRFDDEQVEVADALRRHG